MNTKLFRFRVCNIVNNVRGLAIDYFQVKWTEGDRFAKFLLAKKGYGGPFSKEEMNKKQLEVFKRRVHAHACDLTDFDKELGYMVIFCRMYLKDKEGVTHPAYGAYVYPNRQPGHNVITEKKEWLPDGKYRTTALSQPMGHVESVTKENLLRA